MSAVMAMTAIPAVLPEKKLLTAAVTMILTDKPACPAQRLRRRNRNVSLTATKADVIVTLVLTAAAEQDSVAVPALHPLLIPNQRRIRNRRPHPSLNRKSRVALTPAPARAILLPSRVGRPVRPQPFAEVHVIIIVNQAVLTPVPAKDTNPPNQAGRLVRPQQFAETPAIITARQTNRK